MCSPSESNASHAGTSSGPISSVIALTLVIGNDQHGAFRARAREFSSSASDHRLNQVVSKSVQSRAPNQSLIKANDVNVQMAALRKQAKAEMITIAASLWSNMPFKRSEKVCRVRAFANTSAVLWTDSVNFVAFEHERERDFQIG